MALTAGAHHFATVTADMDMGPLLSAGFNDPDGLWGEVCWDRPPDEVRGGAEVSGWKRIAYPDRD